MVHFTKVHGLGNDFIVLEEVQERKIDYRAVAKVLCLRNTWIGADGLLLVCPSKKADIGMRIINADGSEAEMCGNGIRAFAKYVYERGIVQKERFTIETGAGIMTPELILEDGEVEAVRVDMGKPLIAAKEIPIEGGGEEPFLRQKLRAGGRAFTLSAVRVGVPHVAVHVEDPIDFPVEAYGPLIEHDPLFPERTNVNFIRVKTRKYIVQRTWERGCGRTLACGTGACSVAVACMLERKVERKVTVQLELGKLTIEWPEDDGSVFMTGPAKIAFDGEFDETKMFVWKY